MGKSKTFWTAASVLAAAGIVGCFLLGKRIERSATEKASGFSVATNSVGDMTTARVKDDHFRAAVLQAFGEADPIQRSILFGNAFRAWFQNDREAALAWLQQMPRGNEYTQGIFIALPAIAKTDPQRAFALAAAMATTHEQLAIYSVLLDQMAQGNLSSALDYVWWSPAGEARENALRAVADNWSIKDGSAALAWAKNLGDAGERSIAMESVLTSLAATDPQQAFELASQNLAGGALDRVLEKSLKQLAAVDAQSAANAVAQLPPGELQKNSAMDVARSLATQDPAAAISWLQTLPTDTQPIVLNNVLDTWLKQDPDAAGKYVAAMPAGSVQDTAVGQFAENWAAKDASAAVAWAEGLTSSSAQNLAIVNIASGWARTDAADATQWAVNLAADSPARNEALKGAYSYWELADPTAAENYLKTLSTVDQAAIMPKLAAK